MNKLLLITGVLALAVTGCASKSKDIKAAYVSPLAYHDYSCSQVGKELSRVNRRLIEVSGAQDTTAGNDSVAMGVGLILFWPSLFFIAGDDQKEEVSRLKGEYEALEQAAIEKDCDIAGEVEQARRLRQEAEKAQAEQYARDQKTLNQ